MKRSRLVQFFCSKCVCVCCVCKASRLAPSISDPHCGMAGKPSMKVFVVGCFETWVPPAPFAKCSYSYPYLRCNWDTSVGIVITLKLPATTRDLFSKLSKSALRPTQCIPLIAVHMVKWPRSEDDHSFPSSINHLTPNGHFSGHTTPLTYRCCIFYLFNRYRYWIF